MRRLIPVLLSALALAACSGKDDVIEPSPLPEVVGKASLDRLWVTRVGREDVPPGSRLVPAVTGESVYAMSADGRVLAVSRADGRRLWRVATGLAFSAGPVAAYDQLFAGTREGEAIALSATDGRVLWRVTVSGEVLAPPAVAGDLAIFRTAGGRVVALERDTGAERWTWDPGAPALALRAASRPLVVADAVLAGLPGGMLAALSRADGELLWERRIADPEGRSELDRIVDVAGDFVIAGQRLYISTWQGRLVALDLRNGQFVWQQPFSTRHALAHVDGVVAGIDPDSRLVAWRASDGVPLWRVEDFLGRELAGLAVAGEYVVFGDLDGWLHLVRASDGQLARRVRLSSDPIVTSPVVDEGVVYAQDVEGKLGAFRLQPESP